MCGVGPEVLPGLFLFMKSNREVYILGRGRLRVRDFLNTEYCSRVNVILAEKRDSRRHSTTSITENVVMTGTSYQM